NMTAVRRYLRPEQVRELSLVLLIIAVLLFFSTQITGFLSPRFFNRIAGDVAIIAVVAVGETLIILTRNVDLSVGSIVGVSAYFIGTYLANNKDLNPALAVSMAIALGALLGSINGVLVAYGRVPAIITTLGTLAIYRALLVELSGAKTIVIDSMPKWVQDLPSQTYVSVAGFDLRPLMLIALIVVVVFQLMLSYTQFGRRLYAIGSNPDGARFAGLPAQQVTFFAFVLCGALAGLGGFMFLARYGNITVVAAQGMELQVIAAAVVGGVSIAGGQGTVLGALLGALLINILQQSLIRWTSISAFWINAFLGMLILAAIAVDALIMNRVRDLWARTTVPMSEAEAKRAVTGK
ncbi:MAG: ABC transporter permease, partial [Anaerolineales bacterium]|nr:ABC transporter permease [Anaerolineales bacterium]